MSKEEFGFLVGTYLAKKHGQFEKPNWISKDLWEQTLILSSLHSFHNLVEDLTEHREQFEAYFSKPGDELPLDWLNNLESIQKLLFIKVFDLPNLQNFVKKLIREKLPPRFQETEIYTVTELYENSKIQEPLFLILTKGVDPSV